MRWRDLWRAPMLAAVVVATGCQSAPSPRSETRAPAALAAPVDEQALPPEEVRALVARYSPDDEPPPRTAEDLRKLLDAEPGACPAGGRAVAAERLRRELANADADRREPALALALAVQARQAARVGRFQEALEWLTEPETVGQSPEERLAAVVRASARARVHAALGDQAAAERSMEAAAAHRARARTSRLAAFDVHLSLARASAAQAAGRLPEAEARYRQTLALARDGGGDGLDRPAVGAALAANLRQQGRAVAAERAARAALVAAVRAREDAGAPAVELARALLAQGRTSDARFTAMRALGLLEEACAEPASLTVAQAGRTLARTLGALGDWAAALAVFESAFERLDGDAAAFRRLYGTSLDYGVALVHAGRPDEGLAHLRGLAVRLRDRHGEDSGQALGARGALGLAQLAAGRRELALETLRAATAPYLQGLRTFDATALDDRQRQVVDAYAAAIAERAAARRLPALVDEHFRAAELRRLAGVQRTFGPSVARGAATGEPLAELVARAELTRRKLAAVDAQLEQTEMIAADQLDGQVEERLLRRAGALHATRASLERAIDEASAGYRDLLRPRVLGIDDVQELMNPGEALLAFDRDAVWAVPFSGPASYAPLDPAAVEEGVGALRAALHPGPIKRPREVPAFDVTRAHALYRLLLSEVAPGWRAASHLLVVAGGPVARLPLGVLVTAPARVDDRDGPPFIGYRRVAWLARDYPISVLPTAGSLAGLEREASEPTGGGSLAGFADPWFSTRQAEKALTGAGYLGGAPPRARRRYPRRLELRPAPPVRERASATLAALPALPGSEGEVRALVAAAGDHGAQVFTGSAASEDGVGRADLGRKRVIAFATHALAPGDLDGLEQPALALSAPAVTGESGDGLLGVDEIVALDLDAEWAVLSGAETGEARAAEAVAALVRALGYAGVRSTLVSRWPVHVPAAEALAAGALALEVEEPGLSRAEIVQRAALALIDHRLQVDDRGPVFSYAHPMFWGAFSLYGDGRGGMR